MTPHTALILVDLQHDFMPGGALAVAHANEVIPLANQLQSRYDLIVATQDWHPADHKSFASQHPGKTPGDFIELKGLPQVLWPDHCVQGTDGARFVDTLDMRQVAAIFRKGMDPEVDSYSGFFDNGHLHTTGMAGYLREHAITEVHVLGVATDYCVKFTALDALQEKFHVKLLLPACRGVELKAGDVDAAVAEMNSKGIEIMCSL